MPKSVVNVIGKRELHRSLGTSNRKLATKKAEIERRTIFDWFNSILETTGRAPKKIETLSDGEIADIARTIYLDYRAEVIKDLGEYLQLSTNEQMGLAIREEERAGRLRELLADFDLADATKIYSGLALAKINITLSPNSEAYIKLVKRIREAFTQVFIDVVNNYADTPGRDDNPYFIHAESQEPIPPAGSRRPTQKYILCDLIGPILEELRERRGQKGVAKMVTTFRLMQEYFGFSKDIREITRPDVIQFRSKLQQLPSNASKRYPGKTILEVIEARSPEHDVLSVATINSHIRNLIQFFRMCSMNDPDFRLPNFAQVSLNDPEDDIDKRNPFTADQIAAYLSFSNVKKAIAQKSDMFWITMIGLYHGLRADEIAGLKPENIVVKFDTYCIDLNLPDALLTRKRKGKTKTVPRMIPMHPILIKLGFPLLKETCAGQDRIFNSLRESADGYFSRSISDWTANNIETLGWKGKKLSFHSFRHTFLDALDEATISEKWKAYLGGWRLPGVMNKIYGSREMKEEIIPAISAVSYGEVDRLIAEL